MGSLKGSSTGIFIQKVLIEFRVAKVEVPDIYEIITNL